MSTSSSEEDGTRDVIRRAWEQALGDVDFGDDEHFFSIGGNSLRAVRVMRGLSAEFGVRLPVRLLFDHQTVAELAAAVSEARAAAGLPATGMEQPV